MRPMRQESAVFQFFAGSKFVYKVVVCINLFLRLLIDLTHVINPTIIPPAPNNKIKRAPNSLPLQAKEQANPATVIPKSTASVIANTISIMSQVCFLFPFFADAAIFLICFRNDFLVTLFCLVDIFP